MAENTQPGEALRELVADFQEVFSTPSGQRVYAYLMDKILMRRTPALFYDQNGVPIFPNADRGMYLVALADVAKKIENMMDYDFTKTRRPVVHHRRPHTVLNDQYRG